MFARVGSLLVILAALVALLLLADANDSSDHSSEWTSAETTKLEKYIAVHRPVFSDQGVKCVTKGVESALAPPSSSDKDLIDSNKETFKGITKKCAESKLNVRGIVLSITCQGNLHDSSCVDQIAKELREQLGLKGGLEVYPESEYEITEGVQELNKEL